MDRDHSISDPRRGPAIFLTPRVEFRSFYGWTKNAQCYQHPSAVTEYSTGFEVNKAGSKAKGVGLATDVAQF
jgi:hypothetical protein